MVKSTIVVLLLSLFLQMSALSVQAIKTTSALSKIGALPKANTYFTNPKYQPGSFLWHLTLIKENITDTPNDVRLQKRIDELAQFNQNLSYEAWDRQINQIVKIIDNPKVETNSLASYMLAKIYINQILHSSMTSLRVMIAESYMSESQKQEIEHKILQANYLSELSPEQIDQISHEKAIFYVSSSLDQGSYILHVNNVPTDQFIWLMLYVDKQNQVQAVEIKPGEPFLQPTFEAVYVANYKLQDPITAYPEPWLELDQSNVPFTNQDRIFGARRKYLFIEIVLVPLVCAFLFRWKTPQQQTKTYITDVVLVIVTALLICTIILKTTYSNLLLNLMGGTGILLLVIPILLLGPDYSFTKKQSKSTKK